MPLDNAQLKLIAAAMVYSGGYTTVPEAVNTIFLLEREIYKEIERRRRE